MTRLSLLLLAAFGICNPLGGKATSAAPDLTANSEAEYAVQNLIAKWCGDTFLVYSESGATPHWFTPASIEVCVSMEENTEKGLSPRESPTFDDWKVSINWRHDQRLENYYPWYDEPYDGGNQDNGGMVVGHRIYLRSFNSGRTLILEFQYKTQEESIMKLEQGSLKGWAPKALLNVRVTIADSRGKRAQAHPGKLNKMTLRSLAICGIPRSNALLDYYNLGIDCVRYPELPAKKFRDYDED